MPGHILLLSFKFHISTAQYRRMSRLFAEDFSKASGLKSSIWLINEARSEAGGLYEFENESSLQRFLEGSLASQVTNHPALSDVRVSHFNIMEDLNLT